MPPFALPIPSSLTRPPLKPFSCSSQDAVVLSAYFLSQSAKRAHWPPQPPGPGVRNSFSLPSFSFSCLPDKMTLISPLIALCFSYRFVRFKHLPHLPNPFLASFSRVWVFFPFLLLFTFSLQGRGRGKRKGKSSSFHRRFLLRLRFRSQEAEKLVVRKIVSRTVVHRRAILSLSPWVLRARCWRGGGGFFVNFSSIVILPCLPRRRWWTTLNFKDSAPFLSPSLLAGMGKKKQHFV